MRRRSAGVFLVALSTLTLELLLTRIFDVILYPNLAYMVITCAMLALGLAGIHAAIWPRPAEVTERRLPADALALGVAILAIQPVLNALPFRFELISQEPYRQALYFLLMYLVVGLPFFLAGRIFTTIFTNHGDRIGMLYGADLTGAAIGCVILIPLIRPLGPPRLLFLVAAAIWVAAVLFDREHRWRAPLLVAAALAVFVPLSFPQGPTFLEHKHDRGLRDARARGDSEIVIWDPISKIEVIGWGGAKNIVFDGGTQSSFLYPFNGDLERLRRAMENAIRLNQEDRVQEHFWYRGVFASHYLKRDTGHSALIIGAAAGQEIKAALTFGASRVEAVELVPAVIELGKGRYAEFNGGIFLDPRVEAVAGEGRAYLRASDLTYDVIQLHSDHSSSSIAGGVGALDPTYLMTTDAFLEYFGHLTEEGVLHINHHIYPRMIATAAAAWREMGRSDFRRHVLVVHRPAIPDTLPTVLIKMSPWTEDEIGEMRYFFSLRQRYDSEFAIAENPLAPAASFLAPEFYEAPLPEELEERIPYRVRPPTDNQPYFKFIRTTWDPVPIDPSRYVDLAMQNLLNEPLENGPGIPMDVLHLVVVGALSMLAVLAFVIVPMLTSRIGRAPWPGKAPALVYFSCLGAAFIMIELVLIQKFMKFIGFPLYTYSTVLFTMLLAAGLGSMASSRLGIAPGRRMRLPFAGILVAGGLFVLTHSWVFASLLHLPVGGRIAIAVAYMFPLGFLMGLPFPLGILAVRRHGRAAVAWGWAMNGVFTVVGGLGSVVLSLQIGFNRTELVALAIYLIAALAIERFMRVQVDAPGGVADPV